MNVEELKKYQETLENKYEEIDHLITQIEEIEEKEAELQRLEYIQDKIDDQLDLLDDIIEGIYEVPRKYNELLGLKKEYEKLLGD
ncbi:MAG: hypothetical protein IJN90_03885 [Bacilli bacterium]|nr:hypothetical protein [Bacilli bacterium]